MLLYYIPGLSHIPFFLLLIFIAIIIYNIKQRTEAHNAGIVAHINYFQSDLEKVLSSDENIILYLRSFAVDGNLEEYVALPYNKGYVKKLRHKFDYSLAEEFNKYGNYAALCGYSSHNFGGNNYYVPKEKWKFYIERLIHKASVIVYRPFGTPGVIDEINYIISNNYLRKTIFCIDPEIGPNEYKKFRDKLKHLIPGLPAEPNSTFIYFAGEHNIICTDKLDDLAIYQWLKNESFKRNPVKTGTGPGKKEKMDKRITLKDYFIQTLLFLAFLFLFGFIYNIPSGITLAVSIAFPLLYFIYVVYKIKK